MSIDIKNCCYTACNAWLFVFSILISFGWFFLDGHIGINFSDEGFLWYGELAVLAGQIPIRDFQSYDPARYFWLAGWSYVFGEGIIAMRLSCVVFQCFGVFAGLLVVQRLSKNLWFLLGMTLLLCTWMHPRYKVFEQTVALVSIYAAVFLIDAPTLKRHFYIGILGGVVAMLGINHGAYHVFIFTTLICYLSWQKGFKVLVRLIATWVCGILLGYLPQILMMFFVSGFFEYVVIRTNEIFNKGTNLGIPVPWPWKVPIIYASIPRFFESFFYVAFPVFVIITIWLVWRKKQGGLKVQPELLACVIVTVAYSHYVYSRPDIIHLSHGAPALIIGCTALVFSIRRRGRLVSACALLAIIGISMTANAKQIPILKQIFFPSQTKHYTLNVRDELLTLPADQACIVASAILLNDMAGKNEVVFFAPHYPALYAITGRFSPTRFIYFIIQTPEEDAKSLAELKASNVRWALVESHLTDNREDLHFKNTNPLVFDYLIQNFEIVTIQPLPVTNVALRKKSP